MRILVQDSIYHRHSPDEAGHHRRPDTALHRFPGGATVTDLIGGSQVYTATAMILDFVKIDDWGSAAVGVFLLFVAITVISVASAVILRKA